MKKYLVIGNPIEHSLSPELHNFWIKKNNIKAKYEKMKIGYSDIEKVILNVKNGSIDGVNVTVPYKKAIISYIDHLTPEAEKSKSVNTIYKDNNKIVGHNTDIAGFELSLRNLKYNLKGKKALILGAGGVVPSIILALRNMQASEIVLTNRTMKKAEEIKLFFSNIKIIEWGKIENFDIIINATSVGLKKNDELKINYENLGSNKFFFDIIYNPKETNFLKKAKQLGHKTENGMMMFIYQAHQAFTLWHKIMPKIDDETIKLIKDD